MAIQPRHTAAAMSTMQHTYITEQIKSYIEGHHIYSYKD